MLDSSGVAIATMHSIIVVINIIGNSLVCAIIYKNRDLRIPINYLLINLAIADSMYAAFITPDTFFALTSHHPGGMAGTVLCKLFTGANVAWTAAGSSIVTMVAIATERYYAVVYPLGNKGKLTKRKLKFITFGSWIFSLVLNIPAFIAKNVQDNVCVPLWPEEWIPMANRWMWFVFAVLSMALMAGLYTRVVYHLWFKRNDDNQLTYQQRGVMRVRKRVTLMVIVVTALFGISWLTDTVTHIVDESTSYTMNKVVYTVIHTIILFNTAVNPFVYALINQNFREKMKALLCCTGSTAVIHPATQEPHSNELANVTTPTHVAGECFRE